MCHTTLAQVVLESFTSSHAIHDERFSLILFDLSFLLPPALHRPFPFLLPHAL